MYKTLGSHNYYVYILTNKTIAVLYIGMTNSLKERLHFHNNPEAHSKSFSHKYKCKNLIYYERFSNVEEAIKREKQLKKWRRDKKEWLIKLKNPDLKVLNDEI